MQEQSQSVETKLALMKQGMESIALNVNEIRLDIKNLANVFVSSSKYEEEKKATDLRMALLETELLVVKKSGLVAKWILGSLSAVLGSVLTFLIISYLSNLK